MKVRIEFAPVDVEIDEQTFHEYKDGDEISVKEVELEVMDILKLKSIPPIAYIKEIK